MSPAIAVHRITAEARRRLAGARRGRVHSVFARTVNVELAGLDDARWVSLHVAWPPASVPSPFGLALPPAAGSIGPGARLAVTGEALEVERGPRLVFAGAAVVDTTLPDAAPALPPGCLDPSSPAGGLLPVVAALLAGRSGPPGSLARLAAGPLGRLARATAAGDAGACLDAARPLLGLGPGLTPSGDDCLAGWLAALRVAGTAGGSLLAAAGPALLAMARERTTELSHALLAAAAAGIVAEPVHAFVTMPTAAGRAALLALGATSGADLLGGYVLARRALAAA